MDILSLAAIRMPCHHCGQSYSVPLSDILLSHKIMHEGCPVAEETECPPVFQSRLASQSAVENLRRAWHRLEKRAQKDGGELVIIGPESAAQAGEEKSSSVSVKSTKPKPHSGAA
jgi:hypothetical protein